MTYTVPLTFEREATTPAAAAASEPQTVGASAPQLPDVKKAKPQAKEQVKVQRPPRARLVHPQQPEHPANFAYQPSAGEYRPMY